MLRSRDGDVKPPLICQEAKAGLQVLLSVAPDAVENDHLLLTALERVDSVDFDAKFRTDLGPQ